MKRFIRLSFLLTVILSMLGLNASAYDMAVRNANGVTIFYNYYNEGKELEVTNDDISQTPYTGNVVIPEEVVYENQTLKVTSIGDRAFYDCSGLTSITIPKSIRSIGYYAFSYSSIYTIESLIEEPFAFDNRLVNDFSKVILFVPVGTKSKYESTEGWNKFHHIVEGSPTHVDEGLQVENDISTIYNISGHRITSPQRGINIVRTKDGKIKKVLVK